MARSEAQARMYVGSAHLLVPDVQRKMTIRIACPTVAKDTVILHATADTTINEIEATFCEDAGMMAAVGIHTLALVTPPGARMFATLFDGAALSTDSRLADVTEFVPGRTIEMTASTDRSSFQPSRRCIVS